MKKTKTITQGDNAFDFQLKDQNGKTFRLSKMKGKRVLLSFHPLAWTSVCAKQMKSLEKSKKRFDAMNAVAVGISVDSVPCKNAWAKSLGVNATRLLSDFWPHGGVAQQYGLFRDHDGFAGRANILVDEDQRVIFIKIYPILQLPDIEEIFQVLETTTKK